MQNWQCTITLFLFPLFPPTDLICSVSKVSWRAYFTIMHVMSVTAYWSVKWVGMGNVGLWSSMSYCRKDKCLKLQPLGSRPHLCAAATPAGWRVLLLKSERNIPAAATETLFITPPLTQTSNITSTSSRKTSKRHYITLLKIKGDVHTQTASSGRTASQC